MFSSSRTANAQQRDQRSQFPSIIRTRSQQQHPLKPVDLYASPLKEAIRNHNLHNHPLSHAENNHTGAPVGSQSNELPSGDVADDVFLLPSYKKRASSPSFTTSTHPGKRIRVFGQSSKVNSLSRQHSEESLGSPRIDSTQSPAKTSHSTRGAIPSGSPDKGIVHLDLTRVPHSPSKAPLTPIVPSLSDPIASNSNSTKCVISGTIPKKSLVTSSRLSAENASLPRTTAFQPSPNSTSTSPTKPTPLSALSTALQKLLVAAPAAPAPRPRPSTSMGFTKSSPFSPQKTHTPQPSRRMNDAGASSNTPGDSERNGSGFPRPKTSLGHSRLPRLAKGLGKLGLPLRRPTSAGNARFAPGSGAPFASKQTSLSTVPASPAKSAASLSEHTLPSGSQNISTDIVDVDAWHPPVQINNDKSNANENTSNLEYLVPVADESRPKTQPQLPELVSPSRRASQASLSLSQSLSLPRGRMAIHPKVARSASTSAAAPRPNPRTPIKTRGRTRPPPTSLDPTADGHAAAKHNDPMGGKRSNARMPGSLDVLKDCIIFVDVRTEDGEDAAALFVDMLRGLGARILAKPGKSCTHLVYKSGLPSTITKYKLLSEPRPLPVSIGWVVECVEKREHVDETRFLVNLHDIGVAGGAQRRRSMQPKQMRTMTLGQLDNGEPAEISVRADSSFNSEEPSTSGPVLAGLSPPTRSPDYNLPPLQRARQRSLQILPE